jgi:hypothetical protein
MRGADVREGAIYTTRNGSGMDSDSEQPFGSTMRRTEGKRAIRISLSKG